MKGFILGAALVAMVQACQDPTSPPSAAPEMTSEGTGFEASAVGRHLWAVIDKNGNLVRGSRVTRVAHLGVGKYEVTFYKNVTQCAYVATANNASSEALLAFTASGHESANGVYVEIKDQNRELRNGAFNLVVACDQLGLRFAVVGYSENLVRATPGTTLTRMGSGGYYVTFSSSVARCSYLAAVADPGNGSVPFVLGVVSTGRGPGYSVYVRTQSLAGGDAPDVAFHLVLICSSTRGISLYAVVKGDGSIRRASAGTTSARTDAGRYTITSDRDLSTCATVATRGSVNTTVPSPATLEIVPGPGSNSVGFQVRKLAYFGGGSINSAFHAAMVC